MTKLKCIAAIAALVGAALAQNYQVNWSVVDIGGGAMSSSSFQTAASIGQTAAGQMTGTAYQAFIGFWQIDTSEVGIKEEQHWSAEEPLTTALYTPYPNPSPLGRLPAIHYSLATEASVSISLFDLTGRLVANLVSARLKPGRYTASFGIRPSSFVTSSGIYFLKMTAGGFRATRKLVLQ